MLSSARVKSEDIEAQLTRRERAIVHEAVVAAMEYIARAAPSAQKLPSLRLIVKAISHDAVSKKQLTTTEQVVLELLMAGHSNRSAAEFLGVSPRTIEVHRTRVMSKLGVTSVAGVWLIAFASGLAALPSQPAA